MAQNSQRLSFAKFVEETMGRNIPNSWERINMGYALNEVTESVPAGEIQHLTPSVVHGVTPQSELENNPQKALRDGYELTCAVPGDFIVTMSSYEYGLEYCDVSGGISPDYTVLRPTTDEVRGEFMKYLFKSPIFIKLISLLSSGIRQGKRIYWSDLRNVEIVLPNSSTAKAITDYIDSKLEMIDLLIEEKEKLLALLDEKRMTEIYYCCFGQQENQILKETSTDWATKIPGHWSETRLKFVSDEIIDCEHKTAPNDPEGEFYIIKTSDVRDGKLLLEEAERTNEEVYKEWTRRGEPKPNDIIFTREAPVGEVGIVPEDDKVLLGQRTVLIRPDHSQITTEYLSYSLQSPSIEWYSQLKSQGSTVHHLNVSDIKGMPIFLPPIEEQKDIVEVLCKIDQKISYVVDNIEKSISLHQEQRRTILTDAITGKINLNKAEQSQGQEQII